MIHINSICEPTPIWIQVNCDDIGYRSRGLCHCTWFKRLWGHVNTA